MLITMQLRHLQLNTSFAQTVYTVIVSTYCKKALRLRIRTLHIRLIATVSEAARSDPLFAVLYDVH